MVGHELNCCHAWAASRLTNRGGERRLGDASRATNATLPTGATRVQVTKTMCENALTLKLVTWIRIQAPLNRNTSMHLRDTNLCSTSHLLNHPLGATEWGYIPESILRAVYLRTVYTYGGLWLGCLCSRREPIGSFTSNFLSTFTGSVPKTCRQRRGAETANIILSRRDLSIVENKFRNDETFWEMNLLFTEICDHPPDPR